MGFSGIKDLDFLILENLDDKELVKVSSLNSYFQELCSNENFWKRRTEKRFNKYLYPSLQDYKNKYSKTWKGYYIYLARFLNRVTNDKCKAKREDISLLLEIREMNMFNFEIELLENFYTYKWKYILKDELIYTNIYNYFKKLNYKKNLIFFKYLSNLKNPKINPNYILYDLLNMVDIAAKLKEEEYGKLAKLLLKNPKINLLNLINSLDSDPYPNEYVLDVYLKYIRDQGKVEDLLDKAITFETEETLEEIYNHFPEEKKLVLPKILSSLKNHDENEYIKILRFMKLLNVHRESLNVSDSGV